MACVASVDMCEMYQDLYKTQPLRFSGPPSFSELTIQYGHLYTANLFNNILMLLNLETGEISQKTLRKNHHF